MSSPATSKPAVVPLTLSLIDQTTHNVIKQFAQSQHTIHIGRGSKANSACHALSSGLFRSQSTKVMSQTHAMITWSHRDGKSDKAILTDQGSTNGTFMQKAGESKTFRLKAYIGYEISTGDIITFGKAMGRSSSGSPAYDPIRLRAFYLSTNSRRALNAGRVPVLDLTTDSEPSSDLEYQLPARQRIFKPQLPVYTVVDEGSSGENKACEMSNGGRTGYGFSDSELIEEGQSDDESDGTSKKHGEAMSHVSCIAVNSGSEEDSDREVPLPGALSNGAWKNDEREAEEYYSTSGLPPFLSLANWTASRTGREQTMMETEEEGEAIVAAEEEDEYFEERQPEGRSCHIAQFESPSPSSSFIESIHKLPVPASLESLDRFKQSCYSPILGASIDARSPRSDSMEPEYTRNGDSPQVMARVSGDQHVSSTLDHEISSDVINEVDEPETKGKFAVQKQNGILSARVHRVNRNPFGSPTGFISRSSRLPSPVSPGTKAELDAVRTEDDYQTARDYLQSYNQPADVSHSQLPSPLSSPSSVKIELSPHSRSEEQEGEQEEELANKDAFATSLNVVEAGLHPQQESSTDGSDKEDSVAKKTHEESRVPWEDVLGSDYVDELDWEGRRPQGKGLSVRTPDYWDEDADMPDEECLEELLYWNDLAEEDEGDDDYYEHETEDVRDSESEFEDEEDEEEDEEFKAIEEEEVRLEEERREGNKPSSPNFSREFWYAKALDEDQESDEDFEFRDESSEEVEDEEEEEEEEETAEELEEIQKEQEELVEVEELRKRFDPLQLPPAELEVNMVDEVQSQATDEDCSAADEEEFASQSGSEIEEERQADNEPSSPNFFKEFLYGKDLDEEEEFDEDFEFEEESGEEVECEVEEEPGQEEIVGELDILQKDQEDCTAADTEDSACESTSEVEDEAEEVEGEEEDEDTSNSFNHLQEFLYGKDLDEEDDSEEYREERSVAFTNLMNHFQEKRAARQTQTLPDQSIDAAPALPASSEAVADAASTERANSIEESVNVESVATNTSAAVEALIPTISNKRNHCEIEEPATFTSVATNTPPAAETAPVYAPPPKRRRINLKQVTLSTAVGFAAGIVATVVGLNALEGLFEGLGQQ